MATPKEPFMLVQGTRYQIRSCPTSGEWRQGNTVQINIMRSGHGAVPHDISIQLTKVNHLEATDTYEFNGCVVGTTQAVIGLYQPGGHPLGTVRPSPQR